ncbi:MAG: ATP-binding protein [Marinilabiliaceae bacterium]|jgi:predicted HTH transcriptional regulator|nr:ATP-binding protein [Marinilabiliaceae bacterium]
MNDYLYRLISEGEHKTLDFKYCISDARKIARSISAFANTSGGTLLIGVRDNGSIAGISDEEEYYMVDSAINIYCKPEAEYSTRLHRKESKTVLEVTIPEGKTKPYLASAEDGRWLAYVRKDDQNLLANTVLLKLWKIEQENTDQLIEFSEAESKLTGYLKKNNHITLSAFRKLSGFSKQKCEWILARMISLGILNYEISEESCFYFPPSG